MIRPTVSKRTRFDYIGRIASNRKRIQERPYLFNDREAMAILKKAYLAGHEVNELDRKSVV